MALEPLDIRKRVTQRLKSKGCPMSGLAAPGRIELHVHGEEQHMWSPQLIADIAIESDESVLHGRFGPHPSVWTLYVAAYAACTFGALVGGSFGVAQWVMEATPWALLTVPLAALAAGVLYLVAMLGQGLSIEQMERLRLFLEETLGEDLRETSLFPVPDPIKESA